MDYSICMFNLILQSAKTEKHAKPLYKKTWFIVLMVILVLGVIGSSVGGAMKMHLHHPLMKRIMQLKKRRK